MSPRAKRAAAGAATVGIAAAVNVATGMLTQKWTLAWWITVAVLVVVGGGLQAWLTLADSSSQQTPPGEQAEPGSQRVDDTTVRGALRQTMTKPGQQTVTGSEVGTDLSQSQGGNGDVF